MKITNKEKTDRLPVKFFSLLLLMLLNSFTSKAQVETLESVSVTLSQEKFVQGKFPFDVPFYMYGAIPENCTSIAFTYTIKDSKKAGKKWVAFPPASFSGNKWNKVSATEQTFLIYCPGIHPNTNYEFVFTLETKITSDKVEPLKVGLSTIILKYFYDNKTVKGYTDINTGLTKELNSKLIANPKVSELKDLNGNTFAADINKSEWGNVFDDGWKVIQKIKTDSSALYDASGNLDEVLNIFNNSVTKLKSDLKDVEDKKLTDESTKMLNTQVTSLSPEFKGYNFNSGLQVLKELCGTPDLIKSIFRGKAKISNEHVVESETLHLESVNFLYLLLKRLSSGVFVKKGSEDIILFDVINTKVTGGKTLMSAFETAADDLVRIEANRKKRTDYVKSFPDLTTKMVVSTANKFEAITMADVTTDKTPYLSAEGGIGWAVPFEQAFSYAGANFYPSAVNKKAKYWKTNTRYAIRKSICFNLGIVSFFGDRPANTQSILGKTSATDLMLGVGFRVGRILKINVSGLPYKTNNDNPHSDTFTATAAFVVSAGIDINLLGAFSSVAKALKLIP